MYLSHSARQIQNLTAETLKLLIGGFLRRVAGDGGMAVAPRVFVDIPRGPTNLLCAVERFQGLNGLLYPFFDRGKHGEHRFVMGKDGAHRSVLVG